MSLVSAFVRSESLLTLFGVALPLAGILLGW